MADDPDMLAGEYALGVLEGPDLAEAGRRMLSDRAFAEEVRWWRHRLACMAEAAGSVEPSPEVWPAIERRLDGDAPAPAVLPQRPATGLAGWNLAGALAGVAALAAAVALFWASPATQPGIAPAPIETPAGERYIAQGQSDDGRIRLAGVVEPDANRLTLQLAGFAPGSGQAPELWVVPAGGAPVSLGLIPQDGAVSHELDAAHRALLVEGAALAVTYEDAGSAPHAAPTTDIIVVTPLTRV